MERKEKMEKNYFLLFTTVILLFTTVMWGSGKSSSIFLMILFCYILSITNFAKPIYCSTPQYLSSLPSNHGISDDHPHILPVTYVTIENSNIQDK